MSKMSQAQAELEEQASGLGYASISEAEEDGCRIAYDNGHLLLVKDDAPLYLEVIEGPYGMGISINDIVIAGACGGGVMTVKKRMRVNRTRLMRALDETKSEDKK